MNTIRRWLALSALILVMGTGQGELRGGPAASADAPRAMLYGEPRDDHVRLLWRVKAWPETLKGFQVQRRPIDAAGEPAGDWEPIHEGVIALSLQRPEGFPGVASADENERLSRVAETMRTKNLRQIADRDLVELVKEEPAWLRRLWSASAHRFDFAQVLGLGLADRTVNPAEAQYEYGLFAVQEGGDGPPPLVDGWRSTPPVATLSGPPVREIRLENEGRRLVWEMEAEEAEKFAVTLFRVERHVDDTVTPLIRSPIRYAFERNGRLQWRFLSRDRPIALDELRLVPISIFGTEYPAHAASDLPGQE